jgi:hypothetical protein
MLYSTIRQGHSKRIIQTNQRGYMNMESLLNVCVTGDQDSAVRVTPINENKPNIVRLLVWSGFLDQSLRRGRYRWVSLCGEDDTTV